MYKREIFPNTRKNYNEKFLQIERIYSDIYIAQFTVSLSDFFSGTRSHVCITRARRTCMHWRQETSLPDNFCNDKTTNVFVESTGLYTHIRSSLVKKYLSYFFKFFPSYIYSIISVFKTYT